VATQPISLTGVENDLIGIGQAERMYFAQWLLRGPVHVDLERHNEHRSQWP